MNRFYSAGLVLALAACAGHERIRVLENPNQHAVAKKPGTTVEVFETHLPDKPYRELARVECPDQDHAYCRTMAIKAARQLGADALILIGPSGTQGAAFTWSGITEGASQPVGLVAVAVAYKP